MNIVLALLLLAAAAGTAGDTPDLIDLQGLRASGDDWEIVTAGDTAGGSMVKLYQDKWLMFFLHWRPLNDDRSNLTAEYMRELLLNFWGEDMPFELEGVEGETTVAGHPARYVEGTIYDGMVRTRFIVWNCPETGRQMIADCNINQRLNTPEKFLHTQFEIVDKISCHGQEIGEAEGMVLQRRDEFQLAFPVPAEWRTNTYTDKNWYPEGITLTNGSFWTLTSDSQKYLILQVLEDSGQPTSGLLQEWLSGLEGCDYTLHEQIQVKLGKADILEMKENADRMEARLTMPFHSTYRGQEQREDYVSKAILWTDGERTCALLMGIVAMNDVWGRPTDLTPSEETFKVFADTILANVKVWPPE